MKKSTMALAALLTVLSISVVSVAYAKDTIKSSTASGSCSGSCKGCKNSSTCTVDCKGTRGCCSSGASK